MSNPTAKTYDKLPIQTPRAKKSTRGQGASDALVENLAGQPETVDPTFEALNVPSRDTRGVGSVSMSREVSERGTGKG